VVIRNPIHNGDSPKEQSLPVRARAVFLRLFLNIHVVGKYDVRLCGIKGGGKSATQQRAKPVAGTFSAGGIIATFYAFYFIDKWQKCHKPR
jgi:hypothetical protein